MVAYGGEAEVARLRRLQEEALSFAAQSLAAIDTTPHGECSHPAVYVARVCASCSAVVEIEP